MTKLSNVPMQTASVITQTTHPFRVLKAILQTERVITQSVDATERPIALIEKLRNRRKEWASNPHYWMDSNLISDVFNDVIDIVRQHQAESEVQDD